MITTSLKEVGAGRSIVIDERGVIIVGNGTAKAAGAEGLKLRIVDAPGDTLVAVRRKDLSEAQKRRLALLDNRAAELAGWDEEVLASYRDEGIQLDDLWERPPGFEAEPEETEIEDQFGVTVLCATEAEQQKVFEDLTGRGLNCRVVVV